MARLYSRGLSAPCTLVPQPVGLPLTWASSTWYEYTTSFTIPVFSVQRTGSPDRVGAGQLDLPDPLRAQDQVSLAVAEAVERDGAVGQELLHRTYAPVEKSYWCGGRNVDLDGLADRSAIASGLGKENGHGVRAEGRVRV